MTICDSMLTMYLELTAFPPKQTELIGQDMSGSLTVQIPGCLDPWPAGHSCGKLRVPLHMPGRVSPLYMCVCEYETVCT